MLKYRFIACDMDGTLLNSSHAVSRRNIEAVNRYIDAGGIFVPATGRCLHSALICLPEIKINAPIVCFSGALAADGRTGRTLYEKPVMPEVSMPILRFLQATGEYVQVYIGDSIFTQTSTEITEWYRDVCGVQATITGEPLWHFVEHDRRGLHKILTVTNVERAAKLVKEIEAEFGKVASVCLSSPTFVETGSKEADKSAALEFVLSMYGIKMSEILAIGDGMNDVSMVKNAGFGIAMGNAFPDVKAVAKFVGDTNDNDGVAQIIEKLCFGER